MSTREEKGRATPLLEGRTPPEQEDTQMGDGNPTTPSSQLIETVILGTKSANNFKKKAIFPLIPQKRSGQIEDLTSPEEAQRTNQLRNPFEQALNSSFGQRLAKEKIEQARTLLIEAAALLKENEQTRVLDLLETFRDYTEERQVTRPAKAIATQVLALEKTAKSLSKATSLVGRNETPLLMENREREKRKEGLKTLYAAVTRGNISTGIREGIQEKEKEREWTIVGRPKERPTEQSRLILSLGEGTTIEPRKARDRINEIFTRKGHRDFLAVSASRSAKGNLVLYFKDRKSKEVASKNLNTIQEVLPVLTILDSTSWFKAVVHGVSTKEFNTPTGIQEVRKEIEHFNQGFKLQTDPIWLTSRERRDTANGAAILVAFETEEMAIRAIRNRIYIGGESLRVEKVKDKTKEGTKTHTEC